MTITGELRNWSIQSDGNKAIYWGHLYGDTKQRWREGTFIHTSLVEDVKEYEDHFIVTTMNSVYKLMKDQKHVNASATL